jgi:hypothetical protein
LDEARLLARLQHPNIVDVFEVETVDGIPYVAMEHINGPTLGKLHKRAVRAGLDTLVKGQPGGKALPTGSTVMMVSVPRVQDLRAVGLAKQASSSRINCENFWASYDVCRIATASDANFSAIEQRQKAYNARLVTLVSDYGSLALDTGIEVVTDYDPTVDASIGSYRFQPGDINGGDCFHPSIQGQNKLSEVIWSKNPHK